MTGEQFNLITLALKGAGIARTDVELAKHLGTTTQTIRNLRRSMKVPPVYPLACAALHRRLDPWAAFDIDEDETQNL